MFIYMSAKLKAFILIIKSKLTSPKLLAALSFKNFKSGILIYGVLFSLLGGGYYLLRSHAATMPNSPVVSIEGETLTGSGIIVRDNNASGNRALRLTSTTPATKTVTVPSAATDIKLSARGRMCSGAPQVIISVDGKQVMVATVSVQKYKLFSVKATVLPGQHTISAALANPYSKSSCTRALIVDVLGAYDTTVSPPADTQQPSVIITSPVNNATVSQVVDITVQAVDNVGIARIEFMVDNGLVSTVIASPFSFSWNTATATNGLHTIKVIAFDAANNSATSSINLTVNRTVSAGANLPIQYSLSSLTGTQRFVATNGSDTTGNGTQSAPYATISKASSVAVDGDSIVVRGGTYRQGNIILTKKLKVIAYPGEVPTFNGAQAASGSWTTEGALSYHAYTAQPVTDGSGLSFTTGQNLAAGAIGRFPDQVWIGTTQLQQVADKQSVITGKFFVDSAHNRVYLSGTDAAKKGIEVSEKDVFMNIRGSNTTLEGLQITRFSNSANDYGVILFTATADNSMMRNVAIYDSAFITVSYANSGSDFNANSTLKNVTIANSNWMGVSAVYTDNLSLDAVKITNMNQFGEFLFSPQSGALKTSRTRHTKVINSDISLNNSNGLWFDQSNVDVDIANNQMIDNKGSAIFFEISDDLLVVNNYIKSSSTKPGAIKMAGSSGLKVINNTIVGGADPIGIYTDVRSKPTCADPRQPVCAGSHGSDRDTIRPRPATLDWIPRLDLMINNIVSYPTASGYCGALTMCIGSTNGSTVVSIDKILHKADKTRKDLYGNTIPQTQMNSNVYANGTGQIISTSIGRYTTISAFGTAMAGSPVYITGLESIGRYGNSWVNSDGSPTSALAAIHNQATAVPFDTNINQYVPAGTKHYGVTYK